MGIAAEILTTLRAETSQYQSEMRKASRETDDFADGTSRMAQVGKFSLLAIGTAAVAMGGVSIKAASDYEQAHARLVTAIQNSGSTWDEQRGKVEDLEGRLRNLGFTDTDVEGSMVQLVGATKDAGEATDLMGLAADIAAGRHTSLAGAVGILTRVESGRVSGLQRLNIDIKDNEGKLISQQVAIQRLTDMYGGSAAAASETFAGKLKVLEAQLDHVAVAVGEVLIPILVDLADIGADVFGFFEENTGLAIALAAVIGGPLALAMAVFIGQQIQLAAVWVFERIQDGIDAVETLANGILDLATAQEAASTAMTTAQAGEAAATEALVAAKGELVAAQAALADAQALGVGAAEASAVAEAEVVLADEALTVAELEAAAAAEVLAAAEEEAAAAGLGMGLGLAATAAIVVVATAAIIGTAYALGYFDDSVSQATKSGQEFARTMVEGITNTHNTIDSYNLVKDQVRDYGRELKTLQSTSDLASVSQERVNDRLSIYQAALLGSQDSTSQSITSQKGWREEAEHGVATIEHLTAVHDGLKSALEKLKPEYDKAIENQKKVAQEATVTAAVFGVTIPDAEVLSQAQSKALTGTFEALSKIMGTDMLQATVNLASRIPDIGFALQDALKKTEQFGNTIQGSVNKFTDVFSSFKVSDDLLNFGVDAQAQFDDFFVRSQAGALKWSQDIESLIHRGVDQGIIDNIARAGPGSQPALDMFINLVDQNGVEWVNRVQSAGRDAAQVTTNAYASMATDVAIKTAEAAAVGKAFFEDLKEHGSENLKALAGTGDEQLERMVQAALAKLPQIPQSMSRAAGDSIGEANRMAGGVIGAINSIPKDTPAYVHLQVLGMQQAYELQNLLNNLDGRDVQANAQVLIGVATAAQSDRAIKRNVVPVSWN